MERRKFIKSACHACLLGAVGIALPGFLESCGSVKSSVYKTAVRDRKVEVPLSLMTPGTTQLVRPEGWFYDIAIHQEPTGAYKALLLKCTHMDNQLDLTPSGFSCSMHGSLFDKEGQVRKGPAERSLQSFRTSINDQTLTIYL